MPAHNLLLAALPERERKALSDDLELVPLASKQTLQEPGRPVRHIHFPLSGVVSMVTEPNSGEVVEFATVGREGMIGLPPLLASDSMPGRAIVQVPGEALRIGVPAFRRALDRSTRFRDVLMRSVLALLTQIAQTTSCNRLHEVQERCARWLLQTHDRIDDDSFPLTQEFMAQMLGVQRPTVSVAAGMLQKAGVIRYVRGVITIVDRKGLEAASCSCYGIVAGEYRRLLGLAKKSRPARAA